MKTWITKTIVVSACVLGIAGCASPVDRIAEKPHCHTDRGRNAYCTKDPAPSIAKDDDWKTGPLPQGVNKKEIDALVKNAMGECLLIEHFLSIIIWKHFA